jgi:protein-disulfide isomerase
MKLSTKQILIAGVAAVALIGTVSLCTAQEKAAPAVVAAEETPVTQELAQDFLQKTNLEEAMRDYILNNGDVVLQSIENQRMKEQQDQDRQAQETINKENDYLLKNAHSPQAGNADASVTVVEFFDYNCGYCKKAFDDVAAIIESDKDVRVVFKEVPILSPSSREVSKWSLASKEQGKYFEYHQLLMQHKGQYDEESLSSLATQAGLDVEKLKAAKDKPEIDAQLDINLAYMEKFGIRGTPSFVVGNQLIRGYVGKQGLEDVIKQTRAEAKQ